LKRARSSSLCASLFSRKSPFSIPCLRCGECCTRYQVRVDLAEAARIAGEMGMSLEHFTEKYTDARWPGKESLLVRHHEGRCVFLDMGSQGLGTAGCSIHSFKPSSCREWDSSLCHPECRVGLMKISGVFPGQPSEVISLEEGFELYQAHLEAPAASRRN
jgi:hypothetical protein